MAESAEEIAQHEKELDQFKMNWFKLDGKVAIVTGGNTGLGQGYTVALAEAGADVLVAGHGTEQWTETRAMVEKRGRRVEFMQVDLTTPDAADKVIQTALDKFGRIDILVNNAGMIKRNPLLESKDQDWDNVIAINLSAVYHLSLAAAKLKW